MPSNKRIYFAIQQLQIAPVGTTNYSNDDYTVHGLQTVGMNTRFNLEQIFEIGQLAIYENIENIPDVEMTTEKVIDGYAPVYLLATNGAAGPSLSGRSNTKCQTLLSIYPDTLDSASGDPLSEVECSGMFISNLSFTMPVEGNCTEAVTLVGNNKVWRSSAFLATGEFPTNDDTPPGTGGVQRRENVLFGSGESVLPPTIPGITPSVGNFGNNALGNPKGGYNILVSGEYGAHLQQIRVDANLGRDPLYELGRRGPYHRYVNFPVEVRTDIECYSVAGDFVDALEEVENVGEEKIYIVLEEGLILDCGEKNVLQSVSYGGGNAGARGGNVTTTFSYLGYNDLTVKHPEDPSGFAYP